MGSVQNPESLMALVSVILGHPVDPVQEVIKLLESIEESEFKRQLHVLWMQELEDFGFSRAHRNRKGKRDVHSHILRE
jgi:hypothetical protein